MPTLLTVSARTEPLKHSSLLFGLAPAASKARHNANTGDRLRTTMSPACAVSSPISWAIITAPLNEEPTEADEPAWRLRPRRSALFGSGGCMQHLPNAVRGGLKIPFLLQRRIFARTFR